MTIRAYRDEDLPGIADVFTAAVHQLTSPQYDARQREAWAPRPPDLDHWHRRVSSMQVLIAESEDGAIAGFLGYHDTGHIDILFTNPKFARQGIAYSLHERAEHALRKLGVTTLFTEASEIARPFFERCGYSIEHREVVQARGVDLHRYAMRRSTPASPS